MPTTEEIATTMKSMDDQIIGLCEGLDTKFDDCKRALLATKSRLFTLGCVGAAITQHSPDMFSISGCVDLVGNGQKRGHRRTIVGFRLEQHADGREPIVTINFETTKISTKS